MDPFFGFYKTRTNVTHLDVVSLLDYFIVEEVVRHYFVQRWKLDELGVRTMDHRNRQRVSEEFLIYVETSPHSGVVKSVEVFGVVENMEQCLRFFQMMRVEDREDFIVWDHAVFPEVKELLDCDLWTCILKGPFKFALKKKAAFPASRSSNYMIFRTWLVYESKWSAMLKVRAFW